MVNAQSEQEVRRILDNKHGEFPLTVGLRRLYIRFGDGPYYVGVGSDNKNKKVNKDGNTYEDS